MTLVKVPRDFPVISVGEDENGAAGSPPWTQPNMIAWFNLGPKFGSRKGNVVITSHTQQRFTAVGNELNAGLLKPGDILRASDDKGNAACYRYREAVKVWVKDYDPRSNVVYDNNGNPQFAWVVCSDWDPKTKQSMARVVYYADLVFDPNAPATPQAKKTPTKK